MISNARLMYCRVSACSSRQFSITRDLEKVKQYIQKKRENK